MGRDDGLDNIQAQTHAVAVAGTALVRLVEAVEDQRQLLGGDGAAGIADGDDGAVAPGDDMNRQGAALIHEFHRVVHQIVENLSHRVAHGVDIEAQLRHVDVHVEVFPVDALLKAQKGLARCLTDVKIRHLIRGDALIPQTGHIQHIAYQTGQAAHLRGHQLHVIGVLFRGNGAVQHTVHVAGDGGHGRFQLVADVGDEFLADRVGILQGHGHIVEGHRQLLDLLILIARGDADLVVAVGDLPGRCRHVPDGLGLPAGQIGRGQDADAQHQQSHHNEDLQGLDRQGRKGLPADGYHNDADRFFALCCHRYGHCQPLLAVKGGGRHGNTGAVAAQDPGGRGGADAAAQMLAGLNVVGADADGAGGVADENVTFRRGGSHRKVGAEIHIAQVFARIGPGQHRHGIRRAAEGAFLAAGHVAPEKGPEGHADHQGRRQKQAEDHGQRPSEGSLHLPVTSNL